MNSHDYQSDLSEAVTPLIMDQVFDLKFKKIKELSTETPDFEVLNLNGEVVAICELKTLTDSNYDINSSDSDYKKKMDVIFKKN